MTSLEWCGVISKSVYGFEGPHPIVFVGMALVFGLIWLHSSWVLPFLSTTAVFNSRLMDFSKVIHAD